MLATVSDRNELELLSPARDLACGIAAVNCGADAVYIGGPAFSARAQAGNSLADIEKLARHAHFYRARVYAALNTLLFDEELEDAGRLAKSLWEAGVDALIVQDMALAEMGLPIHLHASTQCDNRTPEKVAFLEKCGFSQVVLARELDLPAIREVAVNTSVRLECFIHGALCVSYSGQCHLSRILTGRSANRGTCAQPCRLPATLESGKGAKIAEGHLLSLKDMSRSGLLAALAEAGVSSFKIEGRLKDISYVRNVTSHYRRELDALLEEKPDYRRASSGRSTVAFLPDPAKSFNRGFTPYMRMDDHTSFASPKWVGEEVGRVRRSDRERIDLEGGTAIGNGDGLAWFPADSGLKGLRVNRAEGQILYPAKPFDPPPPGTILYRNHDEAFEKSLDTGSERRKIRVAIAFRETEEGYRLRMTDEDGICAEAEVSTEKIAAKDPGKFGEAISKQLLKLGDTPFTPGEFRLEMERPRFLPASLLNGLRRDASEKLSAARQASYRREERRPEDYPPAPYPLARLDGSANVTNRQAARFYRRHGVEEIGPQWETGAGAAEIPLMTAIHCLRRSFGFCHKENGAAKAPPLHLKIGNRSFELAFDCERCEMTLRERPG